MLLEVVAFLFAELQTLTDLLKRETKGVFDATATSCTFQIASVPDLLRMES